MKDKVLIITSVASMIDQFLYPHLLLLKDMGYDVEVASNFIVGNTCSLDRIEELKVKLTKDNIKYYQVDFYRNVAKVFRNIKAYRQIDNIVNNNHYKFTHCHSPIGGIIGRLVASKRKIKVLYTAHGFHFYKGAPLINWLIYYPIEKYCSRFTDCLITINHEDYELAKSKFRAKKIEYVSGVGIDIEKFSKHIVDKIVKRKELGIPANAKVLLSVGELNKNKNHQIVIRAIKDKDYHYVIAGEGPLKKYLINLADRIGILDRVHILGYRNDASELYDMSDIFVFPSFREGLSVSLMEAMCKGLPCIVSDIRGNRDLISNEYMRFNPKGVNGLINIFNDKIVFEDEIVENRNNIIQFSSSFVFDKIKKIYKCI